MKNLWLCIIALIIAACHQETAGGISSNPDTVPAIVSNSENVGMPTYKVSSYSYIPFVVLNDHGGVDGFETEILNAIAQNQKVRFEYLPMYTDWDFLFKSIETGISDLLSAGMYANPERGQRFELSEPYMETQFVLMSGPNVKITNGLTDLKGKRVAVFKNTMADREIRSLPYADQFTVVHVDSVYEGVKSVIAGRADVFYSDKVVLSYYVNQFKDEGLTIYADNNAEKHQFVFLITKGNTELLKIINDGLKNIKEDGTLNRIKQKWLGNIANDGK